MNRNTDAPGIAHRSALDAYLRLAGMSLLSFVAMYALMYAMVDQWSNVIANRNQAYMAGLMTAPMVLFELLLMSAMYPNVKARAALAIANVAVLGMLWIFIRRQTGIEDEQFLRSMIPHHAGAILMCQEASLTDPDLQRLCANIVSSQQSEIDFMQAKLDGGPR